MTLSHTLLEHPLLETLFFLIHISLHSEVCHCGPPYFYALGLLHPLAVLLPSLENQDLVLTLKARQSSELEIQRQEDYEFETRLNYIASSKLGWALKGNPVCPSVFLSLSICF